MILPILEILETRYIEITYDYKLDTDIYETNVYVINPMKVFRDDITKCKYCMTRWRGGTICICCSILLQKSIIKRKLVLKSLQKIISLKKFVLKDIIEIGFLPQRIMQTLIADTIPLFKQ